MDDPKGQEEQRARDAKIYLASRTHRCYSIVYPTKGKFFNFQLRSKTFIIFQAMNEQAPISQSIQHRNLLCLMVIWWFLGTPACTTYTVWSVNDGAVYINQKPITCGGKFPGGFWAVSVLYKAEILLTTHQGILEGFHYSIIDGPHNILLTRLGRYVVFYKVTRQEFNWSVNASSQAYEMMIRYVITVNPRTV